MKVTAIFCRARVSAEPYLNPTLWSSSANKCWRESPCPHQCLLLQFLAAEEFLCSIRLSRMKIIWPLDSQWLECKSDSLVCNFTKLLDLSFPTPLPASATALSRNPNRSCRSPKPLPIQLQQLQSPPTPPPPKRSGCLGCCRSFSTEKVCCPLKAGAAQLLGFAPSAYSQGPFLAANKPPFPFCCTFFFPLCLHH
jgi:hypothetical protein